MAEREFVDGAFYWVKTPSGWNVPRHEDGQWECVGSEVPYAEDDPATVGPCLGKGPWQGEVSLICAWLREQGEGLVGEEGEGLPTLFAEEIGRGAHRKGERHIPPSPPA